MKTTLMPPDFIIIGAMRAGTTALADLLSRHPEIGMSRLKETDYFIAEKNFSRGPVWYQSLFPMDRPIRGEASPNYAKSDVFAGVPQRIHAARPDVRLIYIVRDPVERFWSPRMVVIGTLRPAFMFCSARSRSDSVRTRWSPSATMRSPFSKPASAHGPPRITRSMTRPPSDSRTLRPR